MKYELTPAVERVLQRAAESTNAQVTPADVLLALADETECLGDVPPSGTCYHDRTAALRAIDAAANRAGEGLRVVEDYVRLVLDDPHLTKRLKSLRHRLADCLARFPMADRLAARETRADVGTRISTPTEQTRENAAAVLTANFVRVQESLRSIEEFVKTIDAELAQRIEALRYEAYTLHRAVTITQAGVARLDDRRLYVLLDGRESLESMTQLAESLVAARVDVLQLRDKTLPDRAVLERARRLREITSGGDTLLIINDRADLAVLSSADGVHLGQDDSSVKDARRIVGPGMLIGVSTHSIAQARQAVLDGADYLGVGPTFPSATKTFDDLPGPALLESVAAEIRLPAYAIGGITLDAVSDIQAQGVTRVAVSAAVLEAADPADVAAMFRERLSS